jgi:hypothetical protein
MKRTTDHPLLKGKDPERTLKILYAGTDPADLSNVRLSAQQNLAKRKKNVQKYDLTQNELDIVELGKGDASSIMNRMKNIEDEFAANPALHDVALLRKKEVKQEENATVDAEKLREQGYTNQRIMTPKMRKLMENKDARDILNEQVNESVLRLKKAKFGHALQDIVPDHKNQFYLPDKSKYFPKGRDLKNTNSQSQIKANSGLQLRSKAAVGKTPVVSHAKALDLERGRGNLT